MKRPTRRPFCAGFSRLLRTLPVSLDCLLDSRAPACGGAFQIRLAGTGGSDSTSGTDIWAPNPELGKIVAGPSQLQPEFCLRRVGPGIEFSLMPQASPRPLKLHQLLKLPLLCPAQIIDTDTKVAPISRGANRFPRPCPDP